MLCCIAVLSFSFLLNSSGFFFSFFVVGDFFKLQWWVFCIYDPVSD